MKNFTNYSNLKQLQLYNIALQNSFARNFKIDEALEKQSTKILNNIKFDDGLKLLYQLYSDSINMLKFQNEQKYGLLKSKIYQNFDFISKYDLYGLMNSLISFCNQQVQKKSPSESLFYREELQLHYFYMYNNGLLNDGNFVPVQHIKNICSLGVLRIHETGRLKFSINETKDIIEILKIKRYPGLEKVLIILIWVLFIFFRKNTIKLFMHLNQKPLMQTLILHLMPNCIY